MPETHEFICTACPKGCMLNVVMEGDEVVKITGASCIKGKGYAQAEITDPRRMVASTVRVLGGLHPLEPVYTAAPVPKARIKDVLAALRAVEVEAPVTQGSVILTDVAGTGIDVLASRDMPRAVKDEVQTPA